MLVHVPEKNKCSLYQHPYRKLKKINLRNKTTFFFGFLVVIGNPYILFDM